MAENKMAAEETPPKLRKYQQCVPNQLYLDPDQEPFKAPVLIIKF